MRIILVFALVAACARDNKLVLQLGSHPNQPSAGFLCADPDQPSTPLFGRTILQGNYDFTFVIDLFQFHDVLPSCFGDDIISTCNTDGCARAQRSCIHVVVPRMTGDNSSTVAQRITDYLQAHASTVFASPPDGAVMIRIVATTARDLTGDACPSYVLASDNVVGCAYSCPEVLDDISGTLQVGIATSSDLGDPSACVAAIDACATFPN